MVLGGIIIDDKEITNFNSTMKLYRKAMNMNAELKWTKISNQKFEEYKKFVDYFFALCDTDKVHFKCMIIDNHQVNHKRYNKGDKESGFYKFYYQLLYNCFCRKYYRLKYKFIVHPDKRQSKYSLEDLRKILNNGIRKNFKINEYPIVAIEPLDSKKSDIMQINDILLGAIGFQKNGYHLLAGSNKSKIELANHIATKAGISDLMSNTKYSLNRFSIWNIKLQRRT